MAFRPEPKRLLVVIDDLLKDYPIIGDIFQSQWRSLLSLYAWLWTTEKSSLSGIRDGKMSEYIDVTDSSPLEDTAQSSSNLISNSQFAPACLEATEHSLSNQVLRPLPFLQTYYLHQTTSTTQNSLACPRHPISHRSPINLHHHLQPNPRLDLPQTRRIHPPLPHFLPNRKTYHDRNIPPQKLQLQHHYHAYQIKQEQGLGLESAQTQRYITMVDEVQCVWTLHRRKISGPSPTEKAKS